MSQFKEKLYEEFEANFCKFTDAPNNRVQGVLVERGEGMDFIEVSLVLIETFPAQPDLRQTVLQAAPNDHKYAVLHNDFL